jgi:hypothetical protein
LEAVAIFIAIEILIFLLATAFAFAIGVSNGGIQEGFRMASGVLFGWFGLVVLGVAAWIVCIAALAFASWRKQPPIKAGVNR